MGAATARRRAAARPGVAKRHRNYRTDIIAGYLPQQAGTSVLFNTQSGRIDFQALQLLNELFAGPSKQECNPI